MLRAVAASVAGEGSSQSQFNSVAFASLPAAASSTGLIYNVSDAGNSLWRSNGTNWLPVGGTATTYKKFGSLAAPIASISAATSGQFSITGGFPTIPAGMLIGANSMLRVMALMRRTGANATVTFNARLGTAGTTGDSVICARSLAATNDLQLWLFDDVYFSSTTVYTPINFIAANSTNTASASDKTTNVNAAAIMTVSLDVSAGNVGDVYELIGLRVDVTP